MADFQKNIFIVALVILSFSLIFIAAVISEKKNEIKFPAETATCPPYYNVEKNDDNILQCTINSNMASGVTDTTTTDCNTFPLYKVGKLQSDKDKCDWAKDCNVTWDGIWKKGKSCSGKSGIQGVIEPTQE